MRLIDANAMRDDWLENGENEYVYDTNAVLDSIDSQPTVDAVVVVRCKDCTKNGLFSCPICFIENKTLQFVNHSPDFYCGDGERRTDG